MGDRVWLSAVKKSDKEVLVQKTYILDTNILLHNPQAIYSFEDIPLAVIEEIDHPYLDASSNGLTYFVERFKGEKIAGHVTLRKGERSALTELGARIL
jgi:predicted ribonuclease YlaK